MARTQVVARFDDPEMQERLVGRLLEAHGKLKRTVEEVRVAMDLIAEVGKALRGERLSEPEEKPK